VHYRLSVASRLGSSISASRGARGALLWLLGAVVMGSMLQCSIDHIPHIYCNVPADCDEAPYSICDVAHHSCITTAAGDLGDGGDDMLVGPDMFCTSSAQCSDEAPICSVQRCRACTDSGDDPQCMAHNPATPRCNAPTGQCVACLSSTDCKNPTPVCNTAAFTCRTCAAHSECMSGVCKSDGQCADAMDIAYVNNGSGCSDMVHASTPSTPYCQIQYAASNASKPYVLVSASTTPYNALNLTATTSAIGPLTIVGPAGRGGAIAATVSQSAVAALSVSTTVSPVTLTIDGLDLRGSGSPTAGAGVNCQTTGGAAMLTIKNSTIQMSGKEGVNSAGCTLTLDANVIFSNTNEGVKLSSTTFVITNNIIHHNGSTTNLPGVNITDSGSTGTLAFDTIAVNGPAGGGVEGGVACPNTGNNVLIQDSIVAQNSHNPATNGTQFVGKCQLQSVVTGADSFSGATQSSPAFVSMADFHLDVTATGLTTNGACCIDKVATATTPNSSHDVDEGPRPKKPATSLDIGAHEAQ
jgi:hypothetical protein